MKHRVSSLSAVGYQQQSGASLDLDFDLEMSMVVRRLVDLWMEEPLSRPDFGIYDLICEYLV